MTIIKLIKRVKNWQSPSRDPWSNCLINSPETTKGQINYYSGRQKDNSKTICRRAGYTVFVYFPTWFFLFVARRVEMVMHVMQMNDNRSWNETHVTVELEAGASSSDLVKTRALLSCR